MEYRILGWLEVRSDPGGPALDLGGPRMRAVLAYLLLHANIFVSKERLVAAVWGEGTSPSRKDHALRNMVSRLRGVLGDHADDPRILLTESGGYRLRVHPGELDADRFEQLVEDAQRARDGGHAGDASKRLEAACELWRGDPLADLEHKEFAQLKIDDLEHVRAQLDRLRALSDLDAGRLTPAIRQLQRLLLDHPTDEGLVAALMRALYAAGRQADAIQAYEDVRVRLDEAVGALPGPELRDLQMQILQHDVALERAPAPRAARRVERDEVLPEAARAPGADAVPRASDQPQAVPAAPESARAKGGTWWFRRRLRAPRVMLFATLLVLGGLLLAPALGVPEHDTAVVAHRCLVAFAAGDRVELGRVLAPTVVFVEAQRAKRIVHRGESSVTKRLMELRSYFDDVRYLVTDQVIQDGTVRSDIRWSGRQIAPFPDGSVVADANGYFRDLEDHVTTKVEHGVITSIIYRRYHERRLDGAA